MNKIWIIAVIIGLFVLSDSLFIVDQTEQAIILQFGEPKEVIKEPGLKLKTPFVQRVVKYDNRILSLDPKAREMILGDQKKVIADSLCRFRISDPLLFYQALNTYAIAKTRLHDAIESSLREVLSVSTMNELLSEKREAMMERAKTITNAKTMEYGIEVIDVRLRSADLPKETSQSIFARMKSEREKEAQQERSEGREIALEIQSKADRERTVLLSNAKKQAEILRGQGDKEALRLWANAAGRNREFYAFYRSLNAYAPALTGNGSYLVLTPDSEFFEYFKRSPAR